MDGGQWLDGQSSQWSSSAETWTLIQQSSEIIISILTNALKIGKYFRNWINRWYDYFYKLTIAMWKPVCVICTWCSVGCRWLGFRRVVWWSTMRSWGLISIWCYCCHSSPLSSVNKVKRVLSFFLVWGGNKRCQVVRGGFSMVKGELSVFEFDRK